MVQCNWRKVGGNFFPFSQSKHDCCSQCCVSGIYFDYLFRLWSWKTLPYSSPVPIFERAYFVTKSSWRISWYLFYCKLNSLWFSTHILIPNISSMWRLKCQSTKEPFWLPVYTVTTKLNMVNSIFGISISQ